jgi:5'-methylthioadenosine/S-adenosylhomocysteine nucleosidase
VGKTLAAMITQQVIGAYRPGAVILTGVAGALAADLVPGDAVVARDLIHHDLDCTALGFARGEVPFTGERVFPCDPALVRAALSAPVSHRLRAGRILSGDRFVTHADKACHAHLTGELAGDAVEMEGAAVAQVCSRNKTPFVVIRTISDRADGSAPEDFSKILPLAAANAAAVTRQILAMPE